MKKILSIFLMLTLCITVFLASGIGLKVEAVDYTGTYFIHTFEQTSFFELYIHFTYGPTFSKRNFNRYADEQKWQFVYNGSYYSLRNMNYDYYIYVATPSPSGSDKLYASSTPVYCWSITPLADGQFRIKDVMANYYLNLSVSNPLGLINSTPTNVNMTSVNANFNAPSITALTYPLAYYTSGDYAYFNKPTITLSNSTYAFSDNRYYEWTDITYPSGLSWIYLLNADGSLTADSYAYSEIQIQHKIHSNLNATFELFRGATFNDLILTYKT
ncbi:RICIN domain-containing protein [Eubacteriales bacterium OttesenSCG-928-G02]|nr:RICIN domain-containing protein [Eubacteriales bacterium OttesenSCG-928-G02]